MKTKLASLGISVLALGGLAGMSLPVHADTPLWVRAQNPTVPKERGTTSSKPYTREDNQKHAHLVVGDSVDSMKGQKRTKIRPKVN